MTDICQDEIEDTLSWKFQRLATKAIKLVTVTAHQSVAYLILAQKSMHGKWSESGGTGSLFLE